MTEWFSRRSHACLQNENRTLLRVRTGTPESENVIVGERSYGRREIDSGECHTRNGM